MNLFNMGRDALSALPALIEALNDDEKYVRSGAASTLGHFGPDAAAAVPALSRMLKVEKDISTAESAAETLGKIGQDPDTAVPALVGVLKDNTKAEDALVEFGAMAKIAVPDLIHLLKDSEWIPRYRAATVLGAIGTEARAAAPALVVALQDHDVGVRTQAACSLGKIGQNQSVALSILIHAFYDTSVRRVVVHCVGDFGVEAEIAVPALIKLLNDEEDVRLGAAYSLMKIAKALQEARRVDSVEQLKQVQSALEQSPDLYVKAQAIEVNDAVRSLQAIRQRRLGQRLAGPVLKLSPFSLGVFAYLVLALVWVGLLWVWPLSIFNINELLKALPRLKLPGWLGGIEVSISHLIVVGYFYHCNRVLDAWVAKNVDRARVGFEFIETVRKCPVQVNTFIVLDGTSLPTLEVDDIRPAFSKTRACVLIWGENERTSLACQIARWGMERHEERRLRKNLMLPVLLDEEFTYRVDKDADPFTKTVRDKLELMLNQEVSTSDLLVLRLLERRRLLVIVDGFSELSEETRASIRLGHADFPAKCLALTASVEEKLAGVPKTVIECRGTQTKRVATT